MALNRKESSSRFYFRIDLRTSMSGCSGAVENPDIVIFEITIKYRFAMKKGMGNNYLEWGYRELLQRSVTFADMPHAYHITRDFANLRAV